ncbi:hypothetical protein AXF42_Ash020688 [Apostasia shenzhenica]|uniref:Uncharacterized protein n=1 Tax=Apostasia shenzhenica TaxID=1088818 RepID=A0A2I0ADY9_9ASPA|nr:hypothetical protein AXF42_Ash020688 [Apostasia shenzhenica]
MICPSDLTIWNVVELSNPVDISSINIVCDGPTIISPVNSCICLSAFHLLPRYQHKCPVLESALKKGYL